MLVIVKSSLKAMPKLSCSSLVYCSCSMSWLG